MPGFLTSIFDPAADVTSEQQSQNDVSASTGQDLSVDQQVSLDVGIGYEGVDGSSHELALENEVGVTLDAGAALNGATSSDDADILH